MAALPAFGSSLLSITASAGTQTCTQSAATYVNCSTDYAEGSADGQITVTQQEPLTYVAQGSVQADSDIRFGALISHNGLPSASYSVTFDLPTESGNWEVQGNGQLFSDDISPVAPLPIYVNGVITGYLGIDYQNYYPYELGDLLIAHAPGTPLTISWGSSLLANSGGTSGGTAADFDLTLSAVAPEPATLTLMALAALCGFASIYAIRKQRQR